MGGGAAQGASVLVDRAERRQLTLVFCDLIDSVALSTRFDPEDLREFITAYQGACVQSVQRYDGYIARYIGDGVLIYFGYPSAHEDDAERAICAALDIVAAVAELPDSLDLGADAQVRMRVGIATGVVVVGDAAAEGVSERDGVVGEAANLAARLQGIAAPNTIVVSEVTRQLAGERFTYRDLGMHDLKGFPTPIPAFQVVEQREVTRLQARGGALAPLIGREQELALMLDRWERAASGSGQVVVLAGRPGIGKSRITAEALRLIGERSARAPEPIVLQYSPYHSNAPLYPVVRYFARLAGIAAQDLPAVKIEKLAPVFGRADPARREDLLVIADLLGMGQPAPSRTRVSPAARRHLGIEALTKHFADSGEGRPAVVVFEDVQWIDPTSKMLLARLADCARSGRGFIVITTRPDARGRADGFLREIGIADPDNHCPSHVTIREIRALQPEDLKMLASAVAEASGSLDPAQMGAILAKSGGIPLYVEELVKAAAKGFDIAGGRGRNDHDMVPATITDALMAQLDRLGEAKEIAQVASVIGHEFPLTLVAEVVHRSAEHLVTLLDSLVETGIVGSGGSDDAYRFNHALIRDISYRSLLRKNRRQLHREIARALSRAGSDAAGNDLIAQHYSLGAAPIDAIEFWKRGAAEAIARSANEEAIAMLTSATAELHHVKGPPQPALELELVLAQAAALRSVRGYSAVEVERRLARARELSAVCGDIETRFSVEWSLFLCTFVKGDIEGARALAAGLLEDAGSEPGPPLVDALLANGMVANVVGDFIAACRFHQAGAELSRPETDEPRFQTHGQNAGLFCLSYLARTQCTLGYLDQARTTIERARSIAAQRAHDPGHIHSCLNVAIHAVRVYHLCGDIDAEKRFAEEVVEIAGRHHYAYYRALGICHLGWVAGAEGNIECGITMLKEGMMGLSDTGTSLSLPGFHVLLAELHLRAGRPEQAMDSLTMAAGTKYLGVWEAEIQRVRGDILARQASGDGAAAEAAYRSSLEIAHRQSAAPLICKTGLSFARLLTANRRSREAHELLNRCLASLQEGKDVWLMREARQMLQELDATL